MRRFPDGRHTGPIGRVGLHADLDFYTTQEGATTQLHPKGYWTASPTEMSAMAQKVLDNAHKYSQAGQPIEIGLRMEDGAAVVDVRDHGHGVDPEDVPNVFMPFFRADRSRRRETGGVGLGLTLAKRIVEAHGGTIDLESRKGEGTTVRIVLPVSASPGELGV